MKRMLMIATHRTLVSNEARLFGEMGYEVLTRFHLDGSFLGLPEDHPARVSTLPEDVLSRLRGILLDRPWLTAHHKPWIAEPDADLANLVADTFDVVYVSTVGNWLLDYGGPAARAGKKVIFRVYGHNLAGELAPRATLKSLTEMPNVTLVAVNDLELNKMWSGWGEHRTSALAHLPLLNNTPRAQERNGGILSLATGQRFNDYEQFRRKQKVTHTQIDAFADMVPDETLERLRRECQVYLEHTVRRGYVIKYGALEAIAAGMPVVLPARGGQADLMRSDKFNSTEPWWWRTPREAASVVQHLLDDSDARDRLAADQLTWLKGKQEQADRTWRKVLDLSHQQV